MLFLSAGEVSGDIYGAELLHALKHQVPGLVCHGFGGKQLKSAGQQQLGQILHRSAVGLTENLPHLRYFKQVLIRAKRWIHQCRPNAVVLVDFQGLNLQIGAYAKALGIPVFYFIAPQAWIWRAPGDLKRISKSCDLILSVFKPEHTFYVKKGLPSTFVGHPLIDMLDNLPLETQPSTPSICWLPGSRNLEVKRLSKPLNQLIKYALAHPNFKHYRHVIPVAHEGLRPLLQSSFKHLPVQFISSEQRYQAMQSAAGIIGASGSAILEVALLGKPTVALYKVSPLTFTLAKAVVKTQWITLPNLLLQTPLVPEFLQWFPTESIFNSFLNQLHQPPQKYLQLREQMLPTSAKNTAAHRASQCILKYVNEKEPLC